MACGLFGCLVLVVPRVLTFVLAKIVISVNSYTTVLLVFG